jgi:hypothetical protein
LSELDTSVLTFPSNDAKELADRIELVMKMQDDAYQILCDKSRKLAVHEHDVRTLMRQLAAVLAETTQIDGPGQN